MPKKAQISGVLLALLSGVLVILLLTPTYFSLIKSLDSDSIDLVFENPVEEEREEERSSAEDEIKELKEFTLPLEFLDKGSFSIDLAIKHQYAFRAYSSTLPVPYMPPEFLA